MWAGAVDDDAPVVDRPVLPAKTSPGTHRAFTPHPSVHIRCSLWAVLPNSLRAVLRRSSDRHCESVNSLYLHTLLLSLTAWHCLYSHEGIDSTHNSDHYWHIQVNYPPADRPPAIAAGVILFFLQLKGVRRPRARARVFAPSTAAVGALSS